ncbi:MAG: error-prone DNA polymerase [Chitinophagaceae bacterium]
MHYTELQVTTNFSFLRGGSHPEELVTEAAQLGYSAIAITDRNTLAGVVRAHTAAKKLGIRMITGCRLDLEDGPSLLAYPKNLQGYQNLSTLLTTGNLRTEKGKCLLYREDVFRYAAGILFIMVAPHQLNRHMELEQTFTAAAEQYCAKLGDSLYLGMRRSYQANDGKLLFRIAQLGTQLSIPLTALNDVHYHNRERRALQDVLTCVRLKCTIYNAGFALYQNAERHLKPVKEMHRLFRHYPQAIECTRIIEAQCTFSLDSLQYLYPEELTTEGRTPQEELAYQTREGARRRFGEEIPESIATSISMELDFIERRNYASYFLTVFDLVQFARSRKILCQGRGSAANSVVCYCLGVTSVNPAEFDLLFARFMSDARDEPPDIDVDFEHERREEVIQYIYKKYGRDRAGVVATVTQVHQKGAIRDVGKAMGLSADAITKLSGSLWEFTEEWFSGERISDLGFDPRDPHLRKILALTYEYVGFPRQLGQHTGGFVITQNKLSALCPILNARMEGRTCIEWNKDDIEALGFMKVDVLALGMLTCIRKGFDLLQQHYRKDCTLAGIPQDQNDVYDMICAADTIGVFQIESRAQMSMLPRLKPRKFYDLVIEVAIVRPGPIQGDMVHPYLRRRDKKEVAEYPSKAFEKILGRTLGVPLFQEQAMEIAIVAGGFSAADADGLRRSMATFKAKGLVNQYEQKLVSGMVANGYEESFAKRVFRQLEGFGSYGFPESHAVSFALLVYVSAWIKCRYPDVFATALLNSLPMGFYKPAQIISDARNHGVTVLPADINYSQWDYKLQRHNGKYFNIRMGLRQIDGLSGADADLLITCRPFKNITELRSTGVSLSALELLADADAFRSIGLDRRQALWEIAAFRDHPEGMFSGQDPEAQQEQQIQLPQMSLSEHVVQDYKSISLSLKNHPVSFLRPAFDQLGITPANRLTDVQAGAYVKVCGLVLVRQRPGTATGICFVTLEDETGTCNIVVFRQLFERYRKEVVRSRLLMVEGMLQKEGAVIHIIAGRCHNYSGHLQALVNPKTEDAGKNMVTLPRPIQIEIFPDGRNFR